jgi:hypothetical protein
MQKVLNGALIKVYINNQLYPQIKSLSVTYDTADYEIYGIDSILPQEVAPGKVSVVGSIDGIRLINDGGLLASRVREALKNLMSGPYISIRVTDRISEEDILFIPKAKVNSESWVFPAKGSVQHKFSFRGTSLLQALDRI